MVQAFWASIAYFTRLPVPSRLQLGSHDLARGMMFFPWLGLLIGILQAQVYWLCQHFLPQELAVLICILVAIALTGGLHEDGLGDCADGFGGGYGDRQKTMAIMKDSRLGSYGVLAITSIVLWRFTCLTALPSQQILFILPFSQAASRLLALFISWSLPYVSQEGSLSTAKTQFHFSWQAATIAALSTLLFSFLLPVSHGLILSSFLVLTFLALRHTFKKKLGGFTGDCLGASQQLAEAVLLGAWVVICETLS